ncbi:hypothetical protein F4V58_01255, partial [Corynebacterium phocae]
MRQQHATTLIAIFCTATTAALAACQPAPEPQTRPVAAVGSWMSDWHPDASPVPLSRRTEDQPAPGARTSPDRETIFATTSDSTPTAAASSASAPGGPAGNRAGKPARRRPAQSAPGYRAPIHRAPARQPAHPAAPA